MRFKHKKLFISGTAVAAAGALGVGAFLQTVLSVQASSEMMPGIETIVNENTEDEPFKILELVSDSADAEIGYYISGQEPMLKLYEYQYTDQSGNEQKVHFSSVQEALSKLPEKYRTEFMMNVKVNDNGTIDSDTSTGIKNVGAVAGDDSSAYPLSYSEYKEKYFLESGDDADSWNKIDMVDFDGKSRTDTVQVNGSYQANTSGTGNYTKADQEYYPIRNDVDSDKNQPEKYRENIQSFYPSEGSDSRGAYYLEFAEVSNDKINSALADENKKKNEILPEYEYANGRYGYYENVYTDLTKEITDNINSGNYQFAGETPDPVADGTVEIQTNENEAVQSNISESNAFSSGEDDNSAVADSNSNSQDDFSVDAGSDSESIDFDNAYPSDESDEFDNGDTNGDSFDSDISLEQQSYEVPVESSDADAFSDDFSDQAVSSDDSGNTADAQISDEQDTPAFDEDGTDVEAADQAGEDTAEQSDQRTVIGRIDDDNTDGTQANPYIYLGKNIDEYPYYQYELIGDLKYVENQVTAVENEIQNNPDRGYKDKDIILENDQYWYYGLDENDTLRKYPLSIVTGRQPVSYNELQTIPTDKINYNYYYRVKKVYFCCKAVENSQEDPSACAYFGWYYPTYPENEDAYLPVTDGQAATHYISEAVYSLTPGSGNYDFVPGGGTSYRVQVNSFYYQGGYSNNDWFKKYVFHLDPKDEEFNTFRIQVDTRSASDVTSNVYATVSGEDTAGQSISVDDVAVGEGEVSGDENIQSDGTDAEVDFTSEYQEPEAADAAEIASEESDNADESGQESSEEENTDAEVIDETDDGTDADVQTDEENAADVGDGETQDDTLATALQQYDLIYINGKPSDEVASAVAASGVACIINAEKTSVTESTSVIADAFSSKIKSATDDADGHYVNTNVYFFKDTFVNATEDNSNLVNVHFNTNFNTDADSEDDKTYGATDAMQGFEEIVKYINSENQYRSLGSTSDTATASDDSGVSDGSTSTQSIEPLTREISQARAIEYIINYKYKRAQNSKKNIKALEIMPDENCSELTSAKVKSWLGASDPEIETITANCAHEETDAAINAIDGNEKTIWHSKWGGDQDYWSGCVNNHSEHYLTVTLKKEEEVSGFYYLGRQDGAATGTLSEYTVELYDKNDKKLGTETGSTGITLNNFKTIGEVELKFSKSYNGVKSVKVTFSHTLGNTDNTPADKYASCAEISFFNLDTAVLPTVTHMTASEFVGHIDDIASEYDLIYISGKLLNNSNTLITGAGDYRYVHVGDGVSAASGENALLKLLGQLEIEYDHTSDGKRWSETGFWTNNNSQNPIWTKSANGNVTINRFAPLNTYGPNGGGFFRGSGNDMTKQQYNELMDFVKSGYPVVIGSDLVTSGRTADHNTVDNSSWYYQFINDTLKYNNVVTNEELDNGSKDIKFFSNLAKPQIIFAENGKPKEVPRENVDDGSGQYAYLSNNELRYTFTIQNDSDVAPAVTTYDCKLYIDLNFDGNLSSKESQDQYIEITDENGTVMTRTEHSDGNQRYELKAGKQYTLVRKIPSDYYKLITWKLVVSSNNNSYIHTSEMGYSKQQNTGSKQTIHVLQLMHPSTSNNTNKPTWDLAKDSTFQNKIRNLDDFQITINQVQITDLKNYTRQQMKALLDEQEMLVLGFADVYQDIPNNNGQVEEILNFVKKGKSIIFAHDTTSYVNYDRDNVYNKIATTQYGQDENTNRAYDNFLENDAHNPTWGLSLNKILRSVVGMDRYGITSTDTLKDGTKVGSLISQGIALSSDSVSFSDLMKLTGDIAYQNDSAKSFSYAQTQAYSNTMVAQKSSMVTSATKVNDGAITQYPYVIDDKIEISETHGQYYQLAMEQDRDINGNSDGQNDVVVWYCLSGNYYEDSPNDVRNNYYFYSKGNVIYTGAGHSTVNKEDEIELFINAMVAAANVTAVRPEVEFVNSLNPAAETETSRYYMTDQSTWTEGENNTLEQNMDFYINVKDYNMVSADLNQEDLDKQEMTIEFYIEDENGEVQDGSGSNKKLKNITTQIASLKGYNGETVTLEADGKFHTKKNNAFGFTLNNVEQYLKQQNGYKESCQLYAKVTSTVYLYGEENKNVVWASIDLKQRQLFEMD